MSGSRGLRALRALRRRDRAEALSSLREAERMLTVLESALRDNLARIARLEEEISASPTEGATRAGVLAMRAEHIGRLERERSDIVDRRNAIVRDIERASVRVGEGKDAVARVMQGLDALERRIGRPKR